MVMPRRVRLLLRACAGGVLLLTACHDHSNAVLRSTANGGVDVGAAQRMVLPLTAGQSMPANSPGLDEHVHRNVMRAALADEVQLPDGTGGVRVAQRYYHTIRACRLMDGSFSTNCPAPAPATALKAP